MTPRYEGIFAIGIGVAAFGIADVTIGNGLIAAFVCGIVLGFTEHDIPEAFVDFAENLSAIAQVITFFVFGVLITDTSFAGSVPDLVLFIGGALLVARPLAIAIAFARSRFARDELSFVAWFGPKGVASMLFALFVLDSQVAVRGFIFDVAAFTILTSIVAHGLTDTVGARWLERRRQPSTKSQPT